VNDFSRPEGTNRVGLDAQRPVLVILAVTTVVSAALSSAYAVMAGGDAGVLTPPVILQAVLLLIAVPSLRLARSGLRIDTMTMLSVWELFRGCVVPVIIQYVGSGDRFFYRLGTFEDAAFVLLLGNVFFGAVLGTRVATTVVSIRLRRLGPRRVRADLGPEGAMPLRASRVSARMLVGLGCIGLVLRFPTPGSVSGFLSGRVEGLQGNEVFDGGPLTYLSMVLRPLLTLGLVLLIVRRRRDGSRWALLLIPLVLSIGFGLASYGLNRAVPVYVLLAIVLVFSERAGRPIRMRAVLGVIATVGAVFIGVGTLRQTLWLSRTGLSEPELGVVPVLQSLLAYGGTPLQLAPALAPSRTSNPFTLFAFVQQFVSPIPGLADPARFQNSSAVFNYVIYDKYSGRDQLLPTWFGSYLTFGLVGVVVTGIIVGVLVAIADALRRRLSTVLGGYAAAFLSIWIAQFGVTSVSVIEQNFFNFVLVPLAIAAVASLWPTPPAPPARTDNTPARTVRVRSAASR
jgi:hypothetical protein